MKELMGALLGLLILSIVVGWVIFPFMVVSKFNELLKVEREILRGHREIAKALQWMVDNWPRMDTDETRTRISSIRENPC
jgi:hypothetical protein